jgi:hypothetical protein
VHGVVVVSPSFARQVGAVCAGTGGRIAGRIDRASVGARFLRVTVSARECGRDGNDTELAIPRAAVVAVALEGE